MVRVACLTVAVQNIVIDLNKSIYLFTFPPTGLRPLYRSKLSCISHLVSRVASFTVAVPSWVSDLRNPPLLHTSILMLPRFNTRWKVLSLKLGNRFKYSCSTSCLITQSKSLPLLLIYNLNIYPILLLLTLTNAKCI